MSTKVAKKNGKRTSARKGGEQMVEFTPDRSIPLIIDGRAIDVEAGQKTKIPAAYKALYDSAH